MTVVSEESRNLYAEYHTFEIGINRVNDFIRKNKIYQTSNPPPTSPKIRVKINIDSDYNQKSILVSDGTHSVRYGNDWTWNGNLYSILNHTNLEGYVLVETCKIKNGKGSSSIVFYYIGSVHSKNLVKMNETMVQIPNMFIPYNGPEQENGTLDLSRIGETNLRIDHDSFDASMMLEMSNLDKSDLSIFFDEFLWNLNRIPTGTIIKINNFCHDSIKEYSELFEFEWAEQIPTGYYIKID